MVKYGKVRGRKYDKITIVLSRRHGEIIRAMADREDITLSEKLRRVLEPWLKQIDGLYPLRAERIERPPREEEELPIRIGR